MFKDICERYWEWRLKEFPTFATVQKNYKYDDVLEDYSLEAFDRRKVRSKYCNYMQFQTLNKRSIRTDNSLSLIT